MHLDLHEAAAFEALDPEAVAGQVRAELARAGVSGNAMAQRLGWQQTYISRRLRAAVGFSATDLLAIADNLGIEPTQLVPLPAEQTADAR